MTGFAVHLEEPRAAWAEEWQKHLQARGWLGLAYTYEADEPERGQETSVNAKLAPIKDAAPLLPNLITS